MFRISVCVCVRFSCLLPAFYLQPPNKQLQSQIQLCHPWSISAAH